MARTSIQCLLFTLLPALITVFYAVGSAEASIHNYDRDPFREVGNAYLVSGGSEGLAATFSVPKPRRAFHSTVHDGLSYIRFENLTFWRSKETADQHPDMAYNSGLIQIIIFEAADRDNIGGSPYSAIWCFQYVRYWKDVLPLQHCIAGVIALGLFEMLFWYLDYSYFNNTGARPVGLTSWVVTIGSIRRTFSRILILSISMGYGVVRPTLGGLTIKVLLLGMTYFVASELLNITEYVGTINDVAGRARVFLVLPDAFLDAFLILWVFTSLSKTLEQLQAKRSSVKLDLYRQFSNALAVTIIASVAWIGYEVYFKATDPFNERWQSGWIITAFWDILAFALLCVICFLWAPSQSSQRYAYSDGKGEDSDDEETESLCKESPRGDISLVKMERKEGIETSDGEDEPEDGIHAQFQPQSNLSPDRDKVGMQCKLSGTGQGNSNSGSWSHTCKDDSLCHERNRGGGQHCGDIPCILNMLHLPSLSSENVWNISSEKARDME
nr:transmembrane protein 87A [Ipomoea batatas]